MAEAVPSDVGRQIWIGRFGRVPVRTVRCARGNGRSDLIAVDRMARVKRAVAGGGTHRRPCSAVEHGSGLTGVHQN
jgi:hypothetical protein